MRKLVTGTFFAGAAAAAAIALTSSPAYSLAFSIHNTNADGHFAGDAAATTLTVNHGGSNVTLSCQSADSTGHAFEGASTGTIDTLNFNDCNLLGLTFEVDTSGDQPWTLTPTSISGNVVTGTISGISAALSGPLCSANVEGPNDTLGSVPASYNNATGQLIINGGGTLVIDDVSGCLGAIGNGDTAGFAGTFDITDPGVGNLTISGP